MKKSICAVTVSQNYLERKKYSIKYLTIGNRKCGNAFWFCRHIGKTGIARDDLEREAIHIAYKNRIPYFADVRHGDNVSQAHRVKMKKYGVAV